MMVLAVIDRQCLHLHLVHLGCSDLISTVRTLHVRLSMPPSTHIACLHHYSYSWQQNNCDVLTKHDFTFVKTQSEIQDWFYIVAKTISHHRLFRIGFFYCHIVSRQASLDSMIEYNIIHVRPYFALFCKDLDPCPVRSETIIPGSSSCRLLFGGVGRGSSPWTAWVVMVHVAISCSWCSCPSESQCSSLCSMS